MHVSSSRLQPQKNTSVRIVRFVVESQIQYVLKRKTPRLWGEWVRTELTMMGPAFIKMGQFLSTRSDIFEKDVMKELAKLQDDITPVDIANLYPILNTSLGRSWDTVFESIDPTPLACASIGQVHVATLKTSKKQVVIKIQKPFVATQIRDDIHTLKELNNILISIGSSRASEIENVLHQYERFLSAELDYMQEMYHMLRFRKVLQDTPTVIPRVYKQLCTSEVLVMEYVPSYKVNDITLLKSKRIDTRSIADILINVFLEMIITHGYVHCDPHPGNIGVAEDGERIVLYDFGNVIELSQEFRDQINNIIFAVYQKDVDEFVDLLLKLKVLKLPDPNDTLEIRMFFRSFFGYLETLDIKTLAQSIRSQEIFASQQSTLSKLKVDPDFLALFRVFSLLDGTCSQLNPDFNYIEALSPYTQDLFMDVAFIEYRARRDLQKMQSYPSSIVSTEQTVSRMQKQVNQTALKTRNAELLLLVGIMISHANNETAFSVYIGACMLYLIQRQITP